MYIRDCNNLSSEGFSIPFLLICIQITLRMRYIDIRNFLLLFALSMVVYSCSNDKKDTGEVIPEDKFTPVGIYQGTLSINAGNELPIVLEDQLVYIDGTNDKTTFKIGVKNFAIGTADYGDIMMPTVIDKTKGSKDYTLDGYSSELTIGELTGSALVLIGTLTEEGVLSFDVDGNIKETNTNLLVKFQGDKTDIKVKDYVFDFESWRVVNPFAPDGTRYSLPETTFENMNWASTDAEVSRMIGIHYMTQFTVGSNVDAFSGKLSAQVNTVSARGLNSIMLPSVYAGYLYLGSFVDNLSNPQDGILLGVPFDSEPLSLKGVYKYRKGEQYFECNNPLKPADVVLNSEKEDAYMIKAYLYQVEDWSSDEILTLSTIDNSPRVVAMAVQEGNEESKDYLEFDISFRWVDGVEYDSSKNYRLVILATASKDGKNYSGAPGSQLRLDLVRIATKN